MWDFQSLQTVAGAILAPCQSYLLDADNTVGKEPCLVSERLNSTATSPRNGLVILRTVVLVTKE